DPCDHRVQNGWWDRTGLLWSEIRLRIGIIMTEKSLDVHVESIGVLKVVCQHDSPCHDHQLK
ncbi:hypothetical protein M9458_003642, partial [Cirrhinus mrigala]